jgi:hypothetical protein
LREPRDSDAAVIREGTTRKVRRELRQREPVQSERRTTGDNDATHKVVCSSARAGNYDDLSRRREATHEFFRSAEAEALMMRFRTTLQDTPVVRSEEAFIPSGTRHRTTACLSDHVLYFPRQGMLRI